MKDKILQILKEQISIEQSGYMNGNADIVGLDDAAEAISQLMCDEAASALRCYTDGKNWENDTIKELGRNGYTKKQITKSLNEINKATQ